LIALDPLRRIGCLCQNPLTRIEEAAIVLKVKALTDAQAREIATLAIDAYLAACRYRSIRTKDVRKQQVLADQRLHDAIGALPQDAVQLVN
jgi:hypothetical protein